MRGVAVYLRRLVVVLAVWLVPATAFADETPAQPINIDKLLQDLRDMDSSTDMQGDHVVGETLC
jgi:hypothetical protein|tara:strand:- start:762 stop:953 length:192 start_codon:yes stop_codon:yes gene_type:complete